MIKSELNVLKINIQNKNRVFNDKQQSKIFHSKKCIIHTKVTLLINKTSQIITKTEACLELAGSIFLFKYCRQKKKGKHVSPHTQLHTESSTKCLCN